MKNSIVQQVPVKIDMAMFIILKGFYMNLPFSYCSKCQTDTPLQHGKCAVCSTSHSSSLKNPVQHPEPEIN